MDIMIVENDYSTISDLNFALEKLGHKVINVASTGDEAIKKAEDLNPDLVLINIKLKGKMSGVQAANKIKGLKIPVIFITVFIKNCLNKSLQLPEDAIVLSLPIRMDHLEYCISRAIFYQ